MIILGGDKRLDKERYYWTFVVCVFVLCEIFEDIIVVAYLFH